MRQHWTMTEVAGLNRRLTVGNSIVDAHDFLTEGVAIGDVVTNVERGTAGTATGVALHEVSTTIPFGPGEPYIITLGTAWTVANEFGPCYEFICRQCGFATERSKMTDGKCPTCQDEPWPERSE